MENAGAFKPRGVGLHWLRHWDNRAAMWARARGRHAVALHELVCFGVKQASACLFGGCMVGLLWLTWAFYPHGVALARYDFLTLAALVIQCVLIVTRLESREEAKVILMFHVAGTAMEVFKTAMGSWVYPEASLLRIGGVPLFSGFMYASIGSYIARAWRLFDFRFVRHPPFTATVWLAMAIYANFFTHHFLPDVRAWLFFAVAALFGRTWVYFRIRQVHRRMPLLLGFLLVATFIWLAENMGTFTAAWRYPAQRHGWSMVPLSKLGAWFLLMIISYVMVSAVAIQRAWTPSPCKQGEGRCLAGVGHALGLPPLRAGEGWGGVKQSCVEASKSTPSQPPPASRGRGIGLQAWDARLDSLPCVQGRAGEG